MDWEKALADLQDDLAMTDLRMQQSHAIGIQFLVKKHQAIRLRMDGNLNHKRPHLHIDYGRELHTASYAIDNGERLAGNLDGRYEKPVRNWIDNNRNLLVQAWEARQSDRGLEPIIAELVVREQSGFHT